MRDIVRVLRLRHKTLARAFSPRNSGSLTEFFSVQFLDLLVNIQRLAEVTRRQTRYHADILAKDKQHFIKSAGLRPE